jgi:hypothetical protein
MTIQLSASAEQQVQSSTTEPASSSTDEEIIFHTVEEYRQALETFDPPTEVEFIPN